MKAASSMASRAAAWLCAVLVIAPALAADTPYRVDIATHASAGNVKVEPSVSGPAGKTLRYEIDVHSETGGATATSKNSGTVRLSDAGNAQLSSNNLTLNPRQKYEMTVRVFDGGELVAEKSARVP